MWQHLLLQNLLGVLDAALLGNPGFGASGADEVERDILLLDHKGFVQTRLDHLHHLGVLEVVDDVLEDVSVGDESECAEDDDDRDLLLGKG